MCIAQDFPFILKAEPPLEIDEEYVIWCRIFVYQYTREWDK